MIQPTKRLILLRAIVDCISWTRNAKHPQQPECGVSHSVPGTNGTVAF
jgi:hypothetical protein